MPKISVIVPVYKVEDYLHQCVDSILAQNLSDYELILVDDGSPDNCGAICDGYAEKDSRIRVIHQQNGGLSAARNAGLDIAQGEYVTFVDSDDAISKTYLESLYGLIVKNDVQISACHMLPYREGKAFNEEIELSGETSILTGREACIQPYIGGAVLVNAWGKLFARSLWSDIRFPVGRIHEDQAVIPIVLYNAEKVAATCDKLYYYRIVENSIMHKPFSLKRYDDIWAVDNCVDYFASKNEQDIVYLARKHRTHLLAVYSTYARKSGIYDQLPKEYQMPERKALRILRKTMTDDKYTYYLAMVHPNWLRPHAYLRKIKKMLHIPCK